MPRFKFCIIACLCDCLIFIDMQSSMGVAMVPVRDMLFPDLSFLTGAC